MHDLRSGRSLPAIEQDPVGLDPPNMAEPENVFDLTHGVQFAGAEHGPAVHGCRPRRIDANEPTRVLQSIDEIADARCEGTGLRVEGKALHDPGHLVERLKVATVVEPRVARPDPADPIWLNAVVQEPDAGVHCRLARSEDGVSGPRSRYLWQVVDGDDSCGWRYLERRNVGGRD